MNRPGRPLLKLRQPLGGSRFRIAAVYLSNVNQTGTPSLLLPSQHAQGGLRDPDEARGLVLSRVEPGALEKVPLESALGRVSGAAILAEGDYPPFDRSLMDGWAVRAADVVQAGASLTVVGDIAAGSMAEGSLQPGQAYRINTGAPIPAGADAVVRIEASQLSVSKTVVTLLEAPGVGEFITRRGEFARKGQTALTTGQRLGPLEIAVAAAFGADPLVVFARPRVGILATGDEIVPHTQIPLGPKIRNSNGPMLQALVAKAGGAPVDLGIVPDQAPALRRAILEGFACDVLCLTGGVSMGQFDLVPGVLEEVGATIHFHKVALRPGRPTLFATSDNGTLIFGLPGNPVSGFIGFELFVKPAIWKRVGLGDRPAVLKSALLEGSLGANGLRRRFLPAALSIGPEGEYVARPLPWGGSGDPIGMVGAGALIVSPPGASGATPGSRVEILILD